jgi:hypothetical protein
MIRCLVENADDKTKLLQERATGEFFRDGQHCYFGEFPLFFAASTGQFEIFEYLVAQGTDLYSRDVNGNTILHMLVIHDKFELYVKVDAMIKAVKNNPLFVGGSPVNKKGYTPLSLAASVGRNQMFMSLVNRSMKVQWKYGPVTSHMYPLEDFDMPLNVDKRDNQVGALEVIVEEYNRELLNNSLVTILLNKKWNGFAENMFFRRFYWYLLYLVVLILWSCVRLNESQIFTSDSDSNSSTPSCAYDVVDWYYVLSELLYWSVLVFISTFAGFKLKQEINEIRHHGYKDYFSGSGAKLVENYFSLSHTVFMFTCLFLRAIIWIFKSPCFDLNLLELAEFLAEWESFIFALAILIAWGYSFFFFLGFRLSGPLIIMIWRMLFTDVVRFLMIYVVSLGTFSHIFFILFRESGFKKFLARIASTFSIMGGDIDFGVYFDSPSPIFSTFLITFYFFVVSIILINILIAMMGATFNSIFEESDSHWKVQWAKIIFSIENEMSDKERMGASCYWTTIENKRYFQFEEIDERHYDKQSRKKSLAGDSKQECNVEEPVETVLQEMKTPSNAITRRLRSNTKK